MGQFTTRLRHVALFMPIVMGLASFAAAGQGATPPGENMSKTPEQVRRELVALMDALPKSSPEQRRTRTGASPRVKEKLAALTAEQLAEALRRRSPTTSSPAAVGRLSAGGTGHSVRPAGTASRRGIRLVRQHPIRHRLRPRPDDRSRRGKRSLRSSATSPAIRSS